MKSSSRKAGATGHKWNLDGLEINRGGGLVSMDTHHHGGALVKREALIRPLARVPPPLGQIANVRMSR